MKKLNPIKPIPKAEMVLWWICRAGLLAWGIVHLFLGYTTQFLQAVFAVIFTHMWDMWQLFGGRSFIIKVPHTFQTQLNVFIFLGCVVGSSLNLHTDFTYTDILFHIFAGYLGAAFAYDFAVIVQSKKGPLSPALASMFSLAFAVMFLVGWEFYEFTMDRLYGLHLQMSNPASEAGLIDTMTDLIYGTSGALAGMFLTAFYRNGKLGRRSREKFEARRAQEEETA